MVDRNERVMPIMLESHDPDDLRKGRAYLAVVGIPWSMIQPHEKQADRNHGGQSLNTLASRGGLSPCEALAILADAPWRRMPVADAHDRLARLVAEHIAKDHG